MSLRYTDAEAREAIAASLRFTEALRRLGMCWSGGNYRTLRKWAARWSIPTEHFDPDAARRRALRRDAIPLARVLVENSTYSRGRLKERLYEEGLKARRCELCGQDEQWRGKRMSLILDHINGDARDNRLENLRIVCPNRAATLDTHCGRRARVPREDRDCRRCGRTFQPKTVRQAYCSRECGQRWDRKGVPKLGQRKARSGRRTTSCSRRSRPAAGLRSGGSTACRTMPSASGRRRTRRRRDGRAAGGYGLRRRGRRARGDGGGDPGGGERT